jgi:hypothetical protein
MPNYFIAPRGAALAAVAVLAGCAGPRDRVAERPSGDTLAVAAAPAAPATISLAAVAGRWKLHATDEDGGNPLDVELVATTDSNWTIIGPNRAPVRERVVAVAGDSIVTDAAYESFLRKGVQVRTRDVYRIRDGKLIGTLEGRYAGQRGDSVARRRLEGTRVR